MLSTFVMKDSGKGHQRILHHFVPPTNQPNARITQNNSFSCTYRSARLTATADPSSGRPACTCCNIAPGEGFVDIWIQIDWDHDLYYNLNILLINA